MLHLVILSSVFMAHQDSKQSVEALEYLRTKVPAELQNPAIGIICGSGLGGLADALFQNPQFAVAYTDIPHFAESTGEFLYWCY